MEIIKSRDNKVLKHYKKLKIKKFRHENKEFMIEGLRFVEDAFASGAELRYCLVSESLEGDRINKLLKDMSCRDVKIYRVEESLIDDMCDTKTPQGIVAIVKNRSFDIDRIIKKSSFIVITDRVQDPGNLGTIIRTSSAANADAVILSEGCVDHHSPKVLRSTMGSVFHLPVVNVENINDTIEELKKNGFSIFVSSLEGSTPYYEQDFSGKTALVIGNEANGVDHSIINQADRLIKIPMPGKTESLNAGIACGIMIFEVVKQRMHVDK